MVLDSGKMRFSNFLTKFQNFNSISTLDTARQFQAIRLLFMTARMLERRAWPPQSFTSVNIFNFSDFFGILWHSIAFFICLCVWPAEVETQEYHWRNPAIINKWEKKEAENNNKREWAALSVKEFRNYKKYIYQCAGVCVCA